MIDFRVNEKVVMGTAKGDVAELFSNVVMLISAIYLGLNDEDALSADTLKTLLKKAMTDDLPFGTAEEVGRVLYGIVEHLEN